MWDLLQGWRGGSLLQRVQKFGIYGGLRAYNSGDLGVDLNNLSFADVGTPSYVSDVANRLVGAKIAHYEYVIDPT